MGVDIKWVAELAEAQALSEIELSAGPLQRGIADAERVRIVRPDGAPTLAPEHAENNGVLC